MWGCGDRCLFLGQKCNFHPIWNSSSSTYGKSQENLFHTTGFRYTEILSLPIYYSAKPRILFKCSFIQGWSDIFLFVSQKKQKKGSRDFVPYNKVSLYQDILPVYNGAKSIVHHLKTSFYEARINKGQYTVLLRNPTREAPNVFTY